MKKIKKLLILNSFVVIPTFFLLSCASALERNRQEFDFGVSTTTINTLNYVKNNSSHQILNSLVESFVKPGPSASNSYGAKLNLPAISFELYNTNLQSTAGDEILQNPAGISPDGSSFTISDFGLGSWFSCAFKWRGKIFCWNSKFFPVNCFNFNFSQ